MESVCVCTCVCARAILDVSNRDNATVIACMQKKTNKDTKMVLALIREH